MSSCLILQDKNNFYIGADTACSVNINGEYYRYSDYVDKIFKHGGDVYFCSGNMKIVGIVNLWINKTFCDNKKIDINLLSHFLKEYWPYSNQDAFDVEMMICRCENGAPTVYQLSQYKNYDIVVHKPRENGINIFCCGYKTNDLYNISKQILLQGCSNVKDLYKNSFNYICDNKVGGNVILYHNLWQVMNYQLQEKEIKYTKNIGDLYLLIAEAVLSGYIESSVFNGGEIMIGLQDDGSYAFRVWPDGSVTMSGGSSIEGYAKEDYVKNEVEKIQNQVDNINTSKMYKVEIVSNSSTIISTSEDKATLTCKVYSWDSDITDTLDASLFNWKRVSSDSDLDNIWNAMPEHQGTKSITIDADDVYYNSSFTCEVDLPE